MKPLYRLAAYPALLLLLQGCSDDSPRRFVDLPHDTVFAVGGLADTLLLTPLGMRPWKEGVVVVDNRSARVVAFRGDGGLAWVYHRPGQGPEEMLRPWDVAGTPEGHVLVLEATNMRLVELSGRGEFLREARLPELRRPPGAILNTGPGEVLLVDQRGEGLFWFPWRDEEGESVALTFPEDAPPRFSSVFTIAGGGTGREWVAGMIFGPRLWWGTGSAQRFSGLVHRPPFRVLGDLVDVGEGLQMLVSPPQTSPYGATSITVDEDEVWVATGGGVGEGMENARNDVIDVYATDGRYLRSHRVPLNMTSIVKSGRRLYLLQFDPDPLLLAVDLL